MIDSYGHLIHIDFGFVFGLAPGKAFSMETAPFKLNAEFIEVLAIFITLRINNHNEIIGIGRKELNLF